MADLSATPPRPNLAKVDKAWIAILLVPVLVWIFDRPETVHPIGVIGRGQGGGDGVAVVAGCTGEHQAHVEVAGGQIEGLDE